MRRIEKNAFERLVREHHAEVYRAARRLVRDEGLALDAVQQTFVELLEGRVDLAAAREPGKLLRCVAARQAAMLLRSERARARREEQVAMQRAEVEPGTDAGEHEARGALRELVAGLPEELRLPLLLRYEEQLTLGEIGGALGLSEAGVHGRLERAQAELRERMGRLGFAAFLPRLPELLRQGESLAIPEQVLPRLLALSSSAWSAGALALLAGAGAAALLAVFVLPHWLDRSAPGPRDTAGGAALARAEQAGGLEVRESGSERRPVVAADANALAPSPGAQAASAGAEGRIAGRVRDELGFAVAGAEVSAASIERQGKFASAARTTRTQADGSFELSVPVWLESGQDYTLQVNTGTLVQPAGTLRVPGGGATPFQRIQLFAAVDERPGSWELALHVRDANGRAVPGAVARVYRSVRHAQGWNWTQWQAGGRADADGELRLRGEGLGPRLLVVEAREQGFAPLRERLGFAESGLLEHEARLEAGLAIRGTLLDERGLPLACARLGAPESLPLHAHAVEEQDWIGARSPEAGRFEIVALTRAAHELVFHSEHWSPFTLHGVQPGGAPLELRLKLRDDPRDVGLHDAELHLRLVDAASGEPLPAARAWTWLDRIEDDDPGLADGDFAPLILEYVVAQTFESSGGEEPAPPRAPEVLVQAGLEAGRYALRVRLEGYAPALLGPLELAPREIVAGRELRLARGASVGGRVLDPDGAPLAGARVLLLGPGERSRRRLAEIDAELRGTAGRGTQNLGGTATDAQGTFRLEHVPSGLRLHACVLHPEREPVEGPALALTEGASTELGVLRAGARRAR